MCDLLKFPCNSSVVGCVTLQLSVYLDNSKHATLFCFHCSEKMNYIPATQSQDIGKKSVGSSKINHDALFFNMISLHGNKPEYHAT